MARGSTAAPEASDATVEEQAEGTTNGGDAQNGGNGKRTKYVIFVSPSENGPWEHLDVVDARSQDEARRLILEGHTEDEAFISRYFFATPANSYKPKMPAVKTRTTVSF